VLASLFACHRSPGRRSPLGRAAGELGLQEGEARRHPPIPERLVVAPGRTLAPISASPRRLPAAVPAVSPSPARRAVLLETARMAQTTADNPPPGPGEAGNSLP
jgi:hypothetical protein